jgi:hypothetical protein
MNKLESQADTSVLDVGPPSDIRDWLTEHKILSWMAEGCSASHARVLCEIRVQKLYSQLNLDWDAFCARHLAMSRRSADRIIDALNEFGDSYFNVTQLVKIPVDQYRAIESAIRDNHLEFEGRRIAIRPENRTELAHAVRKLRRPRRPRPPILLIQKRVEHLFTQLVELTQKIDHYEELKAMRALVKTLVAGTQHLDQWVGQASLHLRAKYGEHADPDAPKPVRP